MANEGLSLAVEALTKAEAAHARLDGYNGSIGHLRDEVAGLRTEHQETREQVVRLSTKAGIMAAIGAFLATAIMAPLAVALTLRYAQHPSEGPAQHAPAALEAKVRR